MSYDAKYPYIVATIFLWIGFVSAISFMEAWLKFRASGITLPLGLGIGRLVFNALNKVEWTLAIFVLLNLIFKKADLIELKQLAFFLPLLILLLQTFWLLPILDQRAEMYIQGQSVPKSNLHFVYIVFEIIKVTDLFVYGIVQFQAAKH